MYNSVSIVISPILDRENFIIVIFLCCGGLVCEVCTLTRGCWAVIGVGTGISSSTHSTRMAPSLPSVSKEMFSVDVKGCQPSLSYHLYIYGQIKILVNNY